MKKSTHIISNLIILVAYIFTGCSSITECDRMQQDELFLLVDVTDPRLFERIQTDLELNFPAFMQRSGLGDIQACQSFTLHIAPIISEERLDLTSKSIAIQRRGQSAQAEQAQKNPGLLLNMMREELENYSQMSKNPVITAESHIANAILKAITTVNVDAYHSTILIYSDLIENNSAFLNLYRVVPSAEQRSDVIKRLLDPYTMQKFRGLRQQGLDPHIVVVLIPTSGSIIFQREVRDFWWQLLTEELGLQNVEFVDNLSQYRVDKQ